METLLILLSIFITYCLGGEVGEIDYHEGSDYVKHDDPYEEKALLGTKGGHVFSLSVQQYRYTHYSSDPSKSSQVESIDYQNIVMLYYDYYRLDQLKIPSIDTLETCELSGSILSSVRPELPDPDEETPDTLTVNFSMTDGSCCSKVYELNTSHGKYYTALYDTVVDSFKCR